MSNYYASELVKRAFNLADLKETDFISHEEQLQYLNDAYTEVINSIIKVGDKQFVREVVLVGSYATTTYTEFKLPFDCYIIHSIKTINGTQIPRATTSDGFNSGTYEIVNNRLRFYGVNTGNIILTYWLKPFYITFPNREISIPYSANDIISSAGNNILLSDGTVYNVLSHSEVIKLEIDTDEYNYYLGNGHYVEEPKENISTVTWKDYSGATIDSVTFVGDTFPNHTFLFDNNYNVLISINANDNSHLIAKGQKQLGAIPAGYNPIAVYRDVILCVKDLEDDKFNYAVYDRLEKQIIDSGTIYTYEDEISAMPVPDFDNMHAALFNGSLVLIRNNDYSVIEESLDNDAFYYSRYLTYGVLSSNGTDSYIISRFPDTYMNFPNEVFYSLIAANLGLRFLTKPNADSSGLKELYQNMYNTYMDSLSQDAGYLVIRNAYF